MTDSPSPADLARFIHPVPVGATIPAGTEHVTLLPVSQALAKRTRNYDREASERYHCWTAEPIELPKPELPTEPRTVIACTLDGKPGAVLVRGGNFWHGVDCNGWSVRDVSSDSNRITDWTVYDPTAPTTDWQRWVDEAKRSGCGVEIDGVYIQTAERYWEGQSAPKSGDGLRERMQVLAGVFEASGNASGFDSATAAWHSAARKLRDALTETGADA